MGNLEYDFALGKSPNKQNINYLEKIWIIIEGKDIKTFPKTGKDWGLKKIKGSKEAGRMLTWRIKSAFQCVKYHDYCHTNKDKKQALKILETL